MNEEEKINRLNKNMMNFRKESKQQVESNFKNFDLNKIIAFINIDIDISDEFHDYYDLYDCFRIGNEYFAKKDYKRALLFFKKSIELADNHFKKYNIIKYSDFFYNIGVCFTKLNYIEAAIELYSYTIMLNPQNSRAFYNIGYHELKRNNIQKAYLYVKRALCINQNDDDYKSAINIIENKLLENIS